MKISKCEHCKIKYIKKKNKQRFCSPKCGAISRYKNVNKDGLKTYQRYHKKYPWIKTYFYIQGRCNNKKSPYCKNGIKNYLTKKDLKYIWFRDEGIKMKSPSIDRKDSRKNYTLENCRFIERSENIGRRRRLNGKWSEKYNNCRSCKTTKKRHQALGLCSRCYTRKMRLTNKKRGDENGRTK